MNRLPIIVVALLLGYSIRAVVVAGAYPLTPGVLILAALLVWLVLRTGTTPRRHR